MMKKSGKSHKILIAIWLLGCMMGTPNADTGTPAVTSQPGMTMIIHAKKNSDTAPLSLLQESMGEETADSQTLEKERPSAASAAIGDKILYLTFDDGPVEGTENVLKILREEGVKATMFCVGRHAKKRKHLFARELQMSNLMIANHTYSHANGHYSRFYSNLWGVMSDVEHAQLILGGRKYLRLAGRNVWRLPEVRRNDRALSSHRRSVEIPKYEQLSKEGFYIYGWDVEWRFDHHTGHPLGTAENLAHRISSIWRRGRTVQRGKVVLLAHDFMFRDAASTEELRHFLRIMKQRGWEFKTIDRYSATRPEPLYIAKYYGKKEKRILASAVDETTRNKRISDAYRPTATPHLRNTERIHRRPAGRSVAGLSLQVRLNNAIRSYDAIKVDKLILNGARINRCDEYGRLALNTAIRANSLHLVKKLLSLGADPRISDARGYTALAAARSFRRSAIEKYLIQYSFKRGINHIAALNKQRIQKAISPLKLLSE